MTKNILEREPKLNYEDITIVPEETTSIKSRSECNPYDKDGFLPLFASCMSSVTSKENINDFNDAHIRAVLPRSYSVEERIEFLLHNDVNFTAFSLQESRDIFADSDILYNIYKEREYVRPLKVCIDLANGHMQCLLDLVREIKARWGDKIVIMTGNIANPETYRAYEEAGVDIARLSVGTGSVCSTSANVAIHYPVFSLLSETYAIKKAINGKCKIVADGGIKGFRDIQKALLYADYVMIGSLFNMAIESAGKTTYGKSYWNLRGYKILKPITTLFTYGREIPRHKFPKVFKQFKEGKLTIWKELFGQSTKTAQAIVAKANAQVIKRLKTSEGLFKYQRVEYNLKGWSENETDFLRSAMSYTNSKNLEEYKDSKWVWITQRAYNN